MSDQIHVNDVGTTFIVTIVDDGVVVDIGAATVLQIIIRKPNGDILTVDADLYTDGTDGNITYSTVAGDLDESGLYKIQAYVEIGSSSYYSSIGSFRVECNLS